MSNQLDTDSKARDVSFLDSYSLERWECVLHYMVGSQQQEGISADAVRILLHAGLMKRYISNYFCNKKNLMYLYLEMKKMEAL